MSAVLSPERRGRITGSRIAAVLGCSPYGNQDTLLREMVRQWFGAEPEFTGNIATRYGQEHESDGVGEWEFRNGQFLTAVDPQQFHVHPELDFLGVTPDGLTETDRGAVEVKCPLWGAYTHWRDVPWYEQQCRLVMECTDRDWVDFVVWRESGTAISRIERDSSWLPSVMVKLTEFTECFTETIQDEKAYGPLLEDLVNVRSDSEWLDAAARWSEANALLKVAETSAELARNSVIQLAAGKSAVGGGVSVNIGPRKGRINWQAVRRDELGGLDLEGYRGKTTDVATVTAT